MGLPQHQSLDQRCPAPAQPGGSSAGIGGKIVRFDLLGGLLREYSWAV